MKNLILRLIFKRVLKALKKCEINGDAPYICNLIYACTMFRFTHRWALDYFWSLHPSNYSAHSYFTEHKYWVIYDDWASSDEIKIYGVWWPRHAYKQRIKFVEAILATLNNH